jgi:hypothetical protein
MLVFNNLWQTVAYVSACYTKHTLGIRLQHNTSSPAKQSPAEPATTLSTDARSFRIAKLPSFDALVKDPVLSAANKEQKLNNSNH